MSQMKLKYKDDNYSIKIFFPSVFKLFGGNLRHINLHEAVRFCWALIYGYRVYHLFANEEEIGYCVIQNGGSMRYPFATKQDIIVGPYFIKPSYRCKKLSIFLVNKCIKEFETQYKVAFDFIQKNNIASIKTTEACDFEYLCDGKYTNLRVLKPKKKGLGDYVIYRYTNTEK